MSNKIQTFEHHSLFLKKDISAEHFNALVEFHKTEKGKHFYHVLHQEIKFKQYVGVLKIDDLTIEILPKIDKYKVENGKKAEDLWQKVLLQMLIRCGKIPVHDNDIAELNTEKYDLFEAYIYLFLKEVERILADGLSKKYRIKEGNKNALTGRLMFGKHILQNLVHQERFYVAHTSYDTQHILHQIISKTLKVIEKLSSEYQHNLSRILFDFPEMPDIAITENTFTKIVYSRNTKRYERVIQLAKMILLHYYPDIQVGSQEVLAILFDMNKLWEKFVLVEMKKHLSEYFVHGQNECAFWVGEKTKKIRPDIWLKPKNKFKLAGKTDIIIDTKWKIPEENTPSDNDLKQMFVYHLYFDAPTTILLYPSNQHLSDSKGAFAKFSDNTLKMCFLNILDKKGDLQNIPFDFLSS